MTSTNRISTFAGSSMHISNMLTTQERMFKTQLQVTTGQVSQQYSGMGNASYRLVNMENQLAEAEHYKASNTSLELRLEVMQSSMEALRATVLEFRGKLQTFEQNNDGVPNQDAVEDIQRWAFQAMQDMESYLNVDVDGQYIYAGSKTQTKPVDLGYSAFEDFQANYNGLDPAGAGNALTPAGVAGDNFYPITRDTHTTTYYAGDNQELSYRVDSDREIKMGLTAIDPAFEKAIRAMGLIAQGAYETSAGVANAGGLQNNLDRVEEALWLLSDALEVDLLDRTAPITGNTEETKDFTRAQRLTGFNQKVVNDTNEMHKTYIQFLSIQVDSIERVDTASAIVRMQDDMRTLEASYAAISKMQELSLTNYLR